mgnify:CR=1 FL=1
MVRVKDSSQPPMQTIRYRLVDSDGDGTNETLERMVNGSSQFLASNVDSVEFAYMYSPNGSVKRVDIVLIGKTEEIKDGVLAGAKSRELRTSVTLRNVF